MCATQTSLHWCSQDTLQLGTSMRRLGILFSDRWRSAGPGLPTPGRVGDPSVNLAVGSLGGVVPLSS